MYDTTKSYKGKIREIIRRTWNSPHVRVKDALYPLSHTALSGWEVEHTDGIGTKGDYHWQRRTFREAVTDAFAMNRNDLLLLRAQPCKLQNHIFLPREDIEAILAIVTALGELCQKEEIAMTAGETAIHHSMRGMELSITMEGIVKHPQRNQMRLKDVLIGLPSNGLHSNGFTKVHEIFGPRWRAEFTHPTAIYTPKVVPLYSTYDVHGMMHITGGAYTKLRDILPRDCRVRIWRSHGLQPHRVFRELYRRGVSDEEMYKTFNCGIGFVLSVHKRDVSGALTLCGGEVIGEVTRGAGNITLESCFSNSIVEY